MQAFYFDTVESTNDLAKAMLRDGRISGSAFIVVREQTAGRGNRGRSWVSPRDAGIYLTVIDRPKLAGTERLQDFTRAAAIACAEVLRETAGVSVRLKPINDLYFDGRKLGGILTEAVIERNEVRALLIGVGINVQNVSRDLLEGHIRPISLEEILAPAQFTELDVRGLALDLVRSIREWNAKLANGASELLEVRWREYCLPKEPAAP